MLTRGNSRFFGQPRLVVIWLQGCPVEGAGLGLASQIGVALRACRRRRFDVTSKKMTSSRAYGWRFRFSLQDVSGYATD